MSDVGPSGTPPSVLTLIGAALTTISGVLFLLFFFLDLVGFHSNPYLGIVTFLLLPAVFALALVLIPLGLWRERRRQRAGPSPEARRWPAFDLNRPNVRRGVALFAALTLANVVIVALAAVSSLEYVDSVGFCGSVCHTVMEPESVAHRNGPHARIVCTACHVGSGAPSFVRAKLGGVRRLAAVVGRSYERPVAVPVRDLPTAASTCEHCHAADAYVGNRPRHVPSYGDDEANTEQTTVLTMRVGGGGWHAGGPHGIHWHASPLQRVEYIAADASRETIPWVRVVDTLGRVREFVAESRPSPQQLAAGERRTMDCADCHNRVGHRIDQSSARAVDAALASGFLPRGLPFVRREAVAALGESYVDRRTADRQLAERLTGFYAKSYPELARSRDPRLSQAVATIQGLHARNVFPAMQVTWGSYPDHLGHTDSPGCFRCHDDAHKAPDGSVIRQDCELCHSQ
jgi:hypothetical protein